MPTTRRFATVTRTTLRRAATNAVFIAAIMMTALLSDTVSILWRHHHHHHRQQIGMMVLPADAQATPVPLPPTCTIDFHCGGPVSAVSVTGTPPNCACTCQSNFRGEFCQECQYGYHSQATKCSECLDGFGPGFPVCNDTCTNHTSSCLGHAHGFGAPCECNCTEGYTGDRCERCAAGYAGYPDCRPDCTNVTVNCNDRAIRVQGTVENCECLCERGYVGAQCESCALGWNGTAPNCVDTCTNPATSCFGYGTGFSRANAPNDCECICDKGYAGQFCERCAAGYDGWPNCRDNCSLPEVSCNGQGVIIGGDYAPNCRCECSIVFRGLTCDRCAVNRKNEPLCNQCADGYDPYPECEDLCDITSVSCIGAAKSVSKVNGRCKCDCEIGYSGDLCDVCVPSFTGDPVAGVPCVDSCAVKEITCNNHADDLSRNFSTGECICHCSRGFAGKACDQCAPGFGTNYPSCVDNCTVPDASCTDVGHGTAVWLDDPVTGRCACNCTERFQGTICGVCSPGYTRYGAPLCADDCTIPGISCHGNAKVGGLRADTNGDCLCDCLFGFAPPDCSKCAVGYDGPRCDRCLPGFSTYPVCVDDCTNVTSSCNGNAEAVGGSRGDCTCLCSTGWADTRCDRCATGYEGVNCDICSVGYGDDGAGGCIDKCELRGVSCNNRARAVELRFGDEPGNCTCYCNPGWDGQRCDVCATGFTGATCEDCLPGYDMPNCRDACVYSSVSCNDNAPPDGIRLIAGECSCSCFDNYAGDRCDRCAAGYENYDAGCHDACTDPAISCKRNATGVSGHYPNCVCECRHPFAGPTCEECVLGFTGSDCTACDTGFFPHSTLTCKDNCTSVNISCYGHATRVEQDASDPANAPCVCHCTDGFAGERCERCAPNYARWPNCQPACTSAFCNGRAVEILGDFPNCTCRCQPTFEGDRCQRCAPQFTGDGCSECAVGYEGHPTCRDACTHVEVSCHGPATEVERVSEGLCRCTCEEGFEGLTCGGCARGYEDWPFCTDSCSAVDVSCNASRASAVSGKSPFCECQCNARFDGYKCNGCQYGYVGADCDQCRPGFVDNMPGCVDDCTDLAISCNNRAYAFLGTSAGACVCDCISRFNGTRCDRCARGYTGENCDECLPGFTGYPECKETCTVPATSCNGRATAVTGSFPDCRCTCKLGWGGLRCERCAVGYTGASCTQCSAGYENFPNCTDACTHTSVSCSSRAYGVTKNADGTCNCDCWPQYAQPTCETCFRAYEGASCDQCAPGYSNIRTAPGQPNCQDACTNSTVSCNGIPGLAVQTLMPSGECHCLDCPRNLAGYRCEACKAGFGHYPLCIEDCSDPVASCDGRADAVNGTAPDCNCYCRKEFTGYRCLQCARGYAGGRCENCAEGFVRVGSDCLDNCTVPALSCFGQGTRVRGSPGNCECICHGNYSLPTCDRCAQGYSGYPNCTDACTLNSVSCNGFGNISAYAVKSNCTCECPANFAGNNCERCADGYANWPQCTESCSSNAVSCNNNSVAVRGLEPPCVCECKHNFRGLTCDECNDGYSPYPLCYDDCSTPDASCHGHATAVNQSAQGCICDCYNNYLGRECDSCAPGYEAYPNCTDACLFTNVSCNNNAITVNITDDGSPGCNCTCRYGWDGPRCERCAAGFVGPDCDQCDRGHVSGSRKCDRCATGYAGHPHCEDACTSQTVSCGDTGVFAVEPDTTVPLDPAYPCVCTCLRGYAGRKCERCASGFNRTEAGLCVDMCHTPATSCNSLATTVANTTTPGVCDCACFSNADGEHCERCASGYGRFPLCTDICTDTGVSCNGHAFNVTNGTATGHLFNCKCSCDPGYAGPDCGQCAPGFNGYPFCIDDCTTLSVSCAAPEHAIGVSRRDPLNVSAGCVCNCAPGFDSSTGCSTCANGYTDYPLCYDACTNGNVSCNGHSTLVSGPPQNCICTCRPEYIGDKCESCAAGRVNYPACEDNCTLTSVSCSSAALSVRRKTAQEIVEGQLSGGGIDSDASPCMCDCVEGYAGDRCQDCATGYEGHPRCQPSCTSIDARCNGNAISVNGTYPNCQCQCATGYTGTTCNRCAPGYAGYPNCADNCTLASVTCPPGIALRTPYWPQCQCDCPSQLTGARCTSCAFGYEDAGVTPLGLPLCIDDCSNVNVSCRGTATNVEVAVPRNGGVPPQCRCTCTRQFAGDRCDDCAPGFDFYPQCLDVCTIPEVSCIGPAHSVTGVAGRCQCSCARGYSGLLCEKCDNGYGSWPECATDCSNLAESCGAGRAVAVRRDPVAVSRDLFGPSHCQCDCLPRFAGRNCSRCSHGYGGWPACTEACTNVTVSCNGFATDVAPLSSTSSSGCNCTCQRGYDGDRCERCATGFDGWPDCRDTCTVVSVSCTGPSGRVRADPDNPGACVCECLAIHNGSLCDRCAEGLDGFPTCYDNCTHVNVSCGIRGVSVMTNPAVVGASPSNAPTTTDHRCLCECHGNYSGTPCSHCAAGYERRDLQAERDEAARNASGAAPLPPTPPLSVVDPETTPCIDACTSTAVSCSSRADAVWRSVGSANSTEDGCVCMCRTGFAGNRCERCAPGYGGYPFCVEDCTNNTVTCNGRAAVMGGANGNCVCECLTGYAGARCESCDRLYVGWPDCILGIDFFDPPGLRRVTGPTIDNKVIRTGGDQRSRVIEIVPVDDVFYPDAAGSAASSTGVERFFYTECIRVSVVPIDDANPFGIARLLRSDIWLPASVTSVAPDKLRLLLLDAPNLQVREPVELRFAIAGKCMSNLVAPRNEATVTILPDSFPEGESAVAAGLSGPGAGIAAATGGLAASNPQVLGMLSDAACTSPRLSRAVGPATLWLLSPLGFWHRPGNVMRPLGAVLTFVIIAVLQLIVAVLLQCVRPVRLSPTRARSSIFARVLGGALAHESAYRVAFPGLTIVAFKVCGVGAVFLSLRTIAEGDSSSAIAAGFIGGACLIGLLVGIAWSWRQGSASSDARRSSESDEDDAGGDDKQKKDDGGDPTSIMASALTGKITYRLVDRVDAAPGGDGSSGGDDRSAIARFFIPRQDWWPMRRSAALFPLLSPVRKPSFAFVDTVVVLLAALVLVFVPQDPMGCSLQMAFLALLFAATAVAAAIKRPFRTPAANVAFFGVAAGLGLTALGLAVEASLPGGFGTATFIAGSMLAHVVSIVAAVCTLLCVGFDLWRTWRRSRSVLDLEDDAVFEERRGAAKHVARERRKVEARERQRAQVEGRAARLGGSVAPADGGGQQPLLLLDTLASPQPTARHQQPYPSSSSRYAAACDANGGGSPPRGGGGGLSTDLAEMLLEGGGGGATADESSADRQPSPFRTASAEVADARGGGPSAMYNPLTSSAANPYAAAYYGGGGRGVATPAQPPRSVGGRSRVSVWSDDEGDL